MNKFKTLFENVFKSKTSILISVLITSALIPLAVNLLFKLILFKAVMENRFHFVLIGLFIYCGWLAILFFLYRKDTIKLKDLTITKQKFITGLSAGIYVFIFVNLILFASCFIHSRSLIISEYFSSIGLTLKTFGLFIFNIIPGAFIEELVFRAYLIPQIFIRINNKLSNSVVSLVVTIFITQVLFAVAHVPRDLFRNDYNFLIISNNLIHLFESGIMLSLIFLRTKNIFFVTIYHAFTNFSLDIVSSPYFVSYSTIVTVIIALLWNKIIEPKETKEGQGLHKRYNIFM